MADQRLRRFRCRRSRAWRRCPRSWNALLPRRVGARCLARGTDHQEAEARVAPVPAAPTESFIVGTFRATELPPAGSEGRT